jgi:hypothetical protein
MSRTAREIVSQLEADSRALEYAERRLTDLLIAIGRCLAASQAAAQHEEAEGHQHTAEVLAAHNDRIRMAVRGSVQPAHVERAIAVQARTVVQHRPAQTGAREITKRCSSGARSEYDLRCVEEQERPGFCYWCCERIEDHIGGAVLSRQGHTTPPGPSGDT